MKFIADENCDYAVVRALRLAGFDVVTMNDINPGADDVYVIRLALEQKRILLTEDKDFGRLVYSYGAKVYGVVFIRYPGNTRKQLARDVLRLAKKYGKKIEGCFVVIEPQKVRFSRLDH